MINELIKLSNHFDEHGLIKEANYLDAVIRKIAAKSSRYIKCRWCDVKIPMWKTLKSGKKKNPTYQWGRMASHAQEMHPEEYLEAMDGVIGESVLSREQYDPAQQGGFQEFDIPPEKQEPLLPRQPQGGLVEGLTSEEFGRISRGDEDLFGSMLGFESTTER